MNLMLRIMVYLCWIALELLIFRAGGGAVGTATLWVLLNVVLGNFLLWLAVAGVALTAVVVALGHSMGAQAMSDLLCLTVARIAQWHSVGVDSMCRLLGVDGMMNFTFLTLGIGVWWGLHNIPCSWFRIFVLLSLYYPRWYYYYYCFFTTVVLLVLFLSLPLSCDYSSTQTLTLPLLFLFLPYYSSPLLYSDVLFLLCQLRCYYYYYQ